MKVEQNKFVSVDYKLTVDGQIADQSHPEHPLEFIFGTGMLLPKFEEAILGKEVGDVLQSVFVDVLSGNLSNDRQKLLKSLEKRVKPRL